MAKEACRRGVSHTDVDPLPRARLLREKAPDRSSARGLALDESVPSPELYRPGLSPRILPHVPRSDPSSDSRRLLAARVAWGNRITQSTALESHIGAWPLQQKPRLTSLPQYLPHEFLMGPSFYGTFETVSHSRSSNETSRVPTTATSHQRHADIPLRRKFLSNDTQARKRSVG